MSTDADSERFVARLGLIPDPEQAGWLRFDPGETGRFIDLFGPILLRREGEMIARCRLMPRPIHRNHHQTVHGGYIMAIVDQVLFLAPRAVGVLDRGGGVTLNTATEFFAPVSIDQPIDAVVEILRVTGRMIFMRGLIEQDGIPAVSFSGTIRKPT